MPAAATATCTANATFGALLRDWRQRRRLSQLDLACDAGVSARHLSFLETGRARPSREMLLHLSELLSVPLRERNAWLLAAGFAPAYRQRALDDPELATAREAVQLVLGGHEPYPAIAVDRHWNLVLANVAAQRLLAALGQGAPGPLPNVLRLMLSPDGLATRIVNLGECRLHMLARLRAQVMASGDRGLAELLHELEALPPLPAETAPAAPSPHADVVMPVRLRLPAGELVLFSTITVFGTPTDITLSELAVEAFFPADPTSAALLRGLSEQR